MLMGCVLDDVSVKRDGSVKCVMDDVMKCVMSQ